MKYVITGSDVGSLHWIAQVLKHVGSECGHNRVYTVDGVRDAATTVLVDPPKGRRARLRYEARLRRGEVVDQGVEYDGDASIWAVPHVPDLDDDVKILHVVRDPIKTVNDMYLLGAFASTKDK